MSDMNGADRQRQLVVRLVSRLAPAERAAMEEWTIRMLAIQTEPSQSNPQKLKQMVAASLSGGVPTVVVRQVWSEVKNVFPDAKAFWEKRSLPARLAAGGVVASLVAFGGKGAGIAALGGAIGLPLWVLFGAGGAFLGMLYEELKRGR